MELIIEQLSAFGKGIRHPDDPFFTRGDEVCKAVTRQGVFDIDDEELYHQPVAAFPCHIPNCFAEFNTLLEFEMHYNGRHRFPCAECKKQLPSAHLLDLHLSEMHDSFFQVQAERKPMYQCFVEECDLRFANPQERRSHCISIHKFPHDFRFDQAHKQKGKGKKKTVLDDAMEMDPPPPSAPKPIKNFFARGAVRMYNTKRSAPKGSQMDTTMFVNDLRDSLPEEMS